MVKTIGVVGAGTMGNGIAQVAAEAGYQVILQDIDEKYVQVGLDAIKKNLHSKVTKGKLEEKEAQEILSRIHGTVNLHDLSEVEVVIEAIIEKMEVKKEIYKRLDSICK